jgi:hypothetical protein
MNMKKQRRNTTRRQEERKKILRLFEEGPLRSQSYAVDKLNINWATLRRDLQWLKEEEYATITTGKRNAKIFHLTFAGLLYAIQIGAIKAKKARNVRKLNKLQFPEIKDSLPLFPELFEKVAKHMEKDHSEIFYRFFADSIIKFDLVKGKPLAPTFVMMGLLSLIYIYILYTKHAKDNFKNNDLILDNGEVLEGFLEYVPLILIMLKPILSAQNQEIVNVKVQELQEKSHSS